MKKTYRIADRVILIDSLYPDVHKLCGGYEAEGQPEITVCTTEEDIETERIKSAREDEIENLPVRIFSPGYLEELAVYRKIAEAMLRYDTFLFHGSVISVDGEAYIFTAKSGTGKSTHTRLWREYLGERAVMVNDDKPLISVKNGKALVYGTPYNGKHGIGNNICVPIKAVAAVERSIENHIGQAEKSELYTLFLQQIYRPASIEGLSDTLRLLDAFIESVSLYKLGCNMDISAARIAYEGMNK